MKPHKHAELIKAWADGAEIQFFDGLRLGWVDANTPNWSNDVMYRIKPEPKPDVVRYGVALLSDLDIAKVSDLGPINVREDNNLKLAFCGETGKLKAAEVLK